VSVRPWDSNEVKPQHKGDLKMTTDTLLTPTEVWSSKIYSNAVALLEAALARIGAPIAAILSPGPIRSLTSKKNVRCRALQTF